MTTASVAAKGASISPADLRKILRWLFLLRICLSSAVVLSVALLWRDFFGARSTFVLLLFLAFSYVFTGYGYWRLQAGGFDRPRFLCLQLLHDLVFVTAVVAYTGGVDSAFAPLYIPLAALASVLFGTSGGTLLACASSAIFILLGVYQREFGSLSWWEPVYFPRLELPREPFLLKLLIFVTLFFLVALFTALVRTRLLTAGARVRELETEIRFITIDTHDILDSIESGVVSVDSAGRVAFINRKAMELLGIRLLANDPQAVWDELALKAPALARILLETLEFKPAMSRGEIELGNPEHQHLPLGITTNILYDERGAKRGVTAVFRDISQVKRMEDLSRHRDRLAAVSELAASLAHEIKNPLAGIRSAVELLSGEASSTSEDNRLFRLIVRESDRLSKLLTDFLEFARMELREQVPIALRELLTEVVELVSLPPGRSLPEIQLEWIGLREPVVEGDYDLVKQLFYNLLANAKQALEDVPGGGHVTVTVSRDYSERAEGYGIDAGRFIEVRVADDGPGIPPENLSRIFQPFFTTKARGTGLGLAIVHRIVNVHGGAIFVESEPGRGTEFRVYLPLSSVPARGRSRVGAERARRGAVAATGS